MPLIESEDAATRLARAIVSDVRLYHGESIARGDDVSEPLEEGRQLFRTRVLPALHPVFERAVSEARLGVAKATANLGGAPDGTLAPVERQGASEPLPPGLFQSPVTDRRVPRAAAPIAVAVLLIAAGFGFWLASH